MGGSQIEVSAIRVSRIPVPNRFSERYPVGGFCLGGVMVDSELALQEQWRIGSVMID